MVGRLGVGQSPGLRPLGEKSGKVAARLQTIILIVTLTVIVIVIV